MLESIVIPFTSIALAELGDKSQLSLLLLATKTKKHLALFLGAMLAFALLTGIAILIGSIIKDLFPVSLIKILSGIAFIVFGLLSLRNEKTDEDTKNQHLGNSFLAGFLAIGLTEWGDKTQLSAIVFSATFHPLAVFVGSMLALSLLSASAIFIGQAFAKKINKRLLHIISAILFIVLGVTTVFSAY